MAERNSLWAWLGIGCFVLFVVAVVVVVGGGFVLYREAKQFAGAMEDPDARASSVLEVLGTDALPAGYHAVTGFSMPFGVLRLAVLSDQPPGPSGQPVFDGKAGLIYVETVSAGQDERELTDYFEGKSSDATVLRRNHINIEPTQILARGVVPLRGNARGLYLAQRGSVSSHGHSARGVMSVIFVDCPADERTRLAIWFGPDVAPPEVATVATVAGTDAAGVGTETEAMVVDTGTDLDPAGSATTATDTAPIPTEAAPAPVPLPDLTGTPADPHAIETFLAPFDLCRAA